MGNKESKKEVTPWEVQNLPRHDVRTEKVPSFPRYLATYKLDHGADPVYEFTKMRLKVTRIPYFLFAGIVSGAFAAAYAPWVFQNVLATPWEFLTKHSIIVPLFAKRDEFTWEQMKEKKREDDIERRLEAASKNIDAYSRLITLREEYANENEPVLIWPISTLVDKGLNEYKKTKEKEYEEKFQREKQILEEKYRQLYENQNNRPHY